jgi:hypothetical protein
VARQLYRISAFTGPVCKDRDDRSFGVVAERLINLVTNCVLRSHGLNPLKMDQTITSLPHGPANHSKLFRFRSVLKFSNPSGILPKLNVMTIHHILRPLHRGVVILAV